jgi:hypothetical protein
MKNTKNNCRRIKSGRIPFFPETALWIQCSLVYRLLLRYHLGLIWNRGNLKRKARRCGIQNCLAIPVPEFISGLKLPPNTAISTGSTGFDTGPNIFTSALLRLGMPNKKPRRERCWQLFNIKKIEFSGTISTTPWERREVDRCNLFLWIIPSRKEADQEPHPRVHPPRHFQPHLLQALLPG